MLHWVRFQSSGGLSPGGSSQSRHAPDAPLGTISELRGSQMLHWVRAVHPSLDSLSGGPSDSFWGTSPCLTRRGGSGSAPGPRTSPCQTRRRGSNRVVHLANSFFEKYVSLVEQGAGKFVSLVRQGNRPRSTSQRCSQLLVNHQRLDCQEIFRIELAPEQVWPNFGNLKQSEGNHGVTASTM